MTLLLFMSAFYFVYITRKVSESEYLLLSPRNTWNCQCEIPRMKNLKHLLLLLNHSQSKFEPQKSGLAVTSSESTKYCSSNGHLSRNICLHYQHFFSSESPLWPQSLSNLSEHFFSLNLHVFYKPTIAQELHPEANRPALVDGLIRHHESLT